MAGFLLPPGFRFHPTDEELIMYYLKRKVMGRKLHFEAISEVNIYNYSPWDLPDKSCLKRDLEWYFFCPRERKYASGARMKRATESGYWKTTGKDRPIRYNDKVVGTVKTLVFHEGHAPHGQRTDWVLHEYMIVDGQLTEAGYVQDAYALCKLFKKKGLGPQNGAQYGAPFKEEDWDDDLLCSTEMFPSGDAAPVSNDVHLPQNGNNLVNTSMDGPESSLNQPFADASNSAMASMDGPESTLNRPASNSVMISMDGPESTFNWPASSSVMTSMDVPESTFNWPLSIASNSFMTSIEGPESTLHWPSSELGEPSSIGLPVNLSPGAPDDDLFQLSDILVDDGALLQDPIDNIEMIENDNHGRNIGTACYLDGNQVYKGEMGSCQMLGDSGFNLYAFQEADFVASTFPDSFLELNDLEIPLNSSAEEAERQHLNSYLPSSSHPLPANECSSNFGGFSTNLQVSRDGNRNSSGYDASHFGFTRPSSNC